MPKRQRAPVTVRRATKPKRQEATPSTPPRERHRTQAVSRALPAVAGDRRPRAPAGEFTPGPVLLRSLRLSSDLFFTFRSRLLDDLYEREWRHIARTNDLRQHFEAMQAEALQAFHAITALVAEDQQDPRGRDPLTWWLPWWGPPFPSFRRLRLLDSPQGRAWETAKERRDRALFALVEVSKTELYHPAIRARYEEALVQGDRGFLYRLTLAIRKGVGRDRRTKVSATLLDLALRDLRLPPPQDAACRAKFEDVLGTVTPDAERKRARRLRTT